MGSGQCMMLFSDPSKLSKHPMQGNIATGEGGLHFLEEEEVIPVILDTTENSPVLSVRG